MAHTNVRIAFIPPGRHTCRPFFGPLSAAARVLDVAPLVLSAKPGLRSLETDVLQKRSSRRSKCGLLRHSRHRACGLYRHRAWTLSANMPPRADETPLENQRVSESVP